MPSIVKGFFSDPEKPLKNYKPTGFTSGGLTGTLVGGNGSGGGNYSVTRTSAGESALRGVQSAMHQRAGEFRGLRKTVAPGFGRISQLRTEAVRDNRRRAVGDLREELRKRRVLGGSFGQTQIAQTEAEFAKLESQEQAQAYLDELGASSALLEQEFGSTIQAAQVELDQLNIESSLAANMSSMATQVMQANATARAEMLSAQAEGAGKLLGTAAMLAFGG